MLYTGIIIDISGLFFIGSFLFSKDETVIEEEVEDHDNYRSKNESASGKDKLISERYMYGRGDIESELIKWSDETE